MLFSTLFFYKPFSKKKFFFSYHNFKLTYANIVGLFLFLEDQFNEPKKLANCRLYKVYVLFLTILGLGLRNDSEAIFVTFQLLISKFKTNSCRRPKRKRIRRFFFKKRLKFMSIIPFFQISRWKAKPFFKKSKFFKVSNFFWKLHKPLFELVFEKFNFKKRKNFSVLFLRKTKSFYKGRYARNRQTCRVIVFWTLAFNLLWLFGLYFFFYQFSFNFGYTWWGVYFFFLSFLMPTILKYKYYNPINMLNEFILFFKWLFLVIKSFF